MLWNRAQEVRSARKPRRRAVIPRNNEHPLAGVLRCGVCNGHMRIAQSSRNAAPRAACASAHQRGTCEHTRSFDMDVLLEDASDKIKLKLLSPKAIEEAMCAWKEERKNDRNKGSEHAKLERRRRVLTTEIERLSYAIANSRRKPDELLKRIDECDLERESVEERLRLLGGGGENVIGFDHPKFSDRYRSEIRRLVTALKINPKAIETRVAFRSLIECIVVHPVRTDALRIYALPEQLRALRQEPFPRKPQQGARNQHVCLLRQWQVRESCRDVLTDIPTNPVLVDGPGHVERGVNRCPDFGDFLPDSHLRPYWSYSARRRLRRNTRKSNAPM